MPDNPIEFDPLDYYTLADTVASALLKQRPKTMPFGEQFAGAGIYLIYYRGGLEHYAPISGTSKPIYVGKAIPPGSRRGETLIESTLAPALWKRLSEHATSIQDAENLDVGDFRCRYLVVTPIWITIVESLLITRFHPVWNAVVDGFGLHDPGKTRYSQKRSDWDTLHPGRPWSPHMQDGKSVSAILSAIRAHLRD